MIDVCPVCWVITIPEVIKVSDCSYRPMRHVRTEYKYECPKCGHRWEMAIDVKENKEELMDNG